VTVQFADPAEDIAQISSDSLLSESDYSSDDDDDGEFSEEHSDFGDE
jgi:hypothetical protein